MYIRPCNTNFLHKKLGSYEEIEFLSSWTIIQCRIVLLVGSRKNFKIFMPYLKLRIKKGDFVKALFVYIS